MLYVNVVHGGTCQSDRDLSYPWQPLEDAVDDVPDQAWPRPKGGGGWFELSDGTSVQGEDEAVDAQAAITTP